MLKISIFLTGFILTVTPIPLYNYYLDHFGYVRPISNNQFYNLGAPFDWSYRSPILPVRNAAWHIKNAKNNPTLLMGSSRSAGFYGPMLASQLRTSLIKLDLPGSTLSEHRYNLEGILDQGAVPHHVIVAIDDFDLYYKGGFNGRDLYPTTLLSRMNFFIDWLFKIPNQDEFSRTLELDGSYQRIGFGELFEISSKVNNISIKRGLDVVAMEATDFSPESYQFFIDDNISFVSDIIELSKEYEFELTLLVTPRWVKSYYRRDHRKIFDFKHKLAGLHPFYDFSGINEYTIDPLYWIDSSHFDTNLGSLVAESIIEQKPINDQVSYFGRLVTKENIELHLAELRSNLNDSLEPALYLYPDIFISEVLENYINPSFFRVRLPKVSLHKDTLGKKIYRFDNEIVKYSRYITLIVDLVEASPSIDPKTTIPVGFNWAEYTGTIKFGTGHRYAMTKHLTIMAKEASNTKNSFLHFDTENVEVSEAYFTFDINSLLMSQKTEIYLDSTKEVYKIGNFLLYTFNSCDNLNLVDDFDSNFHMKIIKASDLEQTIGGEARTSFDGGMSMGGKCHAITLL